MRLAVIATLVLAPLVAAADAPAKPKSGAAMCVLTPADFKAAGITNADKPKANISDGGASAYCVYAGKSSATGGIELDVFSPSEPDSTIDTASGEITATWKPIKIGNADAAKWSPNAKSGGPEFAVVIGKRKSMVFVLGIPAHKDAQARLTKLVGLVLDRLAP